MRRFRLMLTDNSSQFTQYIKVNKKKIDGEAIAE